MQSAEAATPAPTYGTPASSSRPWTVPSSPKGPCSTGRTTSTAPSASAGFESASTGSVSATCLARAARYLGPRAPSGRRGRSRSSSSRSARGRAPPAPSGPRRARSRARWSGRRRRRRRGCACSRTVVVVSRCGCSKRPTTITTSCPAWRRCRPRGPARARGRRDPGRRRSPRPSEPRSRTAPAARWRPPREARHVRDLRGLRPFETWSVITEPLLCCVPAAGFWPTTTPSGCVASSTSLRDDGEAGALQAWTARSRTRIRPRSGPRPASVPSRR